MAKKIRHRLINPAVCKCTNKIFQAIEVKQNGERTELRKCARCGHAYRYLLTADGKYSYI